MEIKDVKSSSGYGKPLWVFKGSALYQLHLVKAETARAFIPKEFKLVEAFGYTLGGFFLANYDNSPAGAFDELVVIAGIVWNPPTSCAWAARVLVNSDEACVHGRNDVGLPSQVARFSKRITVVPKHSRSKSTEFLNNIGIGSASENTKNGLAKSDSEQNSNKFVGPVIKMSLPSFSGHTKFNPHLHKYSCHIQCRIKPVQPAKVSAPSIFGEGETVKQSHSSEIEENETILCVSILLSKPILALEFNSLNMQVQAPVIVSHFSSKNAYSGF